MDAIQKDYDTTQVRIITINLWESWSKVKQYARGNSCLFLRDGTGSVWSDYKHENAIPTNFVLEPDANHTVHNWMLGFNETKIKNWINECLPGVEEEKEFRVESLELRVYPNLFRDKTVIRYSAPVNRGDLRLTIHDIAGRLIRTFLHTDLETIHDSSTGSDGRFTIHEVTWNGKDSRGVEMLSGVYFCKLTTEKVNLIEKLIVVK